MLSFHTSSCVHCRETPRFLSCLNFHLMDKYTRISNSAQAPSLFMDYDIQIIMLFSTCHHVHCRDPSFLELKIAPDDGWGERVCHSTISAPEAPALPARATAPHWLACRRRTPRRRGEGHNTIVYLCSPRHQVKIQQLKKNERGLSKVYT